LLAGRRDNELNVLGVVAVREAYVQEFEDHPDWVHISEFVAERVYTELTKLSRETVLGHFLNRDLDDIKSSFIHALHDLRDEIKNEEVRELSSAHSLVRADHGFGLQPGRRRSAEWLSRSGIPNRGEVSDCRKQPTA